MQELRQAGPGHPRLVWYFFGTSRFSEAATDTEPSLGYFLTSWPWLLGTRTLKKLIGVPAHIQELGQAGPSHPRLVWYFFGTSRFSEAATDTEPSLGGFLDSLQTSWPGLLGTRTQKKLIGVPSSPSGAGTSWTKPSKAGVVLLWYIQDFLRLLQTLNQAWVASWTASKQAGQGC